MKSLPCTPEMRDRLRDFTADRRLLLLAALGLVTGTLGAVAAWALLRLIALITNLAYFHVFSLSAPDLANAQLGLGSIFIPVLGGILVGFIARYGSQKVRGHGIPEMLEAILVQKSRIEPKVAFWKPLASAIAIGTGGPFGAEGPIIMTGGALAALCAQFIRLSSAERKTVLAAGAAAGMTGVFGTPVAAVLLAIEVMLFEWKPRSVVPVIVSVVAAIAWRPWLIGPWPLFRQMGMPVMPWWGLAACAAVGLTAGLQSVLTTRALYWVEERYEKLPIHWMWWPALGGIIVGIGGLIDPAALGIGYDTIGALIHGTVLWSAALTLLVVKSIIWLVSLASGTAGGTLAPLLLMGGAVGALEAHILPCGDSGFWALIAMAAVLGGTLRCPLTAILFAVELTGNLRVMPAIAIACGASFAVSVLLLRRSILTERLARRGRHLSCEYSVDSFSTTRVGEIMRKPGRTLPACQSCAEALALLTRHARFRHNRSVAVLDADGGLIGMLSWADIAHRSGTGVRCSTTLAQCLAGSNRCVGYPDETVGQLADRMLEARIARVPIVDRHTGALLGIVTRGDLLRTRAQANALERDYAAPLRTADPAPSRAD